VRDARVRVDEPRRAVGVRGVDLGRHQHRAVAERAGVEDRRELADDALVEQPLDTRHNVGLGNAGELGHVRERALGEGEAALHQVEQLLVGLVQRDGAAVATRADLGYWLSHRATSLAW
jgi:hypothetical protein